VASLSNITLSIVRDVANAVITFEYDVNWSTYDQLTNLPYWETWKLIGDDTGQDLDDAGTGDDPVNIGLFTLSSIASNGQASTHRVKSRTVAFADLDEDDNALPSIADDEIRAVVTLTPQLPAAVSRESNLVTVTA
jgi:hypothetical protein